MEAIANRQAECSGAAIQTYLTLKVLFDMALREKTGFLEGLLSLVGFTRTVPDLSTLSRRLKTLAVNTPYSGSKGKRPVTMPNDTRDVADVKSDPATAATGKTAVLYRMALPNHLCPAGQVVSRSWLNFKVDVISG